MAKTIEMPAFTPSAPATDTVVPMTVSMPTLPANFASMSKREQSKALKVFRADINRASKLVDEAAKAEAPASRRGKATGIAHLCELYLANPKLAGNPDTAFALAQREDVRSSKVNDAGVYPPVAANTCDLVRNDLRRYIPLQMLCGMIDPEVGQTWIDAFDSAPRKMR